MSGFLLVIIECPYRVSEGEGGIERYIQCLGGKAETSQCRLKGLMSKCENQDNRRQVGRSKGKRKFAHETGNPPASAGELPSDGFDPAALMVCSSG